VFDPEKWLCAKADKISKVLILAKSDQIQIIPDNSATRIRVILPDFSGKEILRIFDLNGRIVQSGLLKAKDSRVEIRKSGNGIYVVEVQSVSQRKTQKVLLSPSQAE